MRAFLAFLLIFVAVNAAPLNVEDALKQIQHQVEALERSIGTPQEKEKEDAAKLIYTQPEDVKAWQPSKRMVAWQPMKRTVTDERAPLIHAIEARLTEVLRAGERLGVSAEEVLADLRFRNHIVN
ncbi:unnamed protein product [Auanema sp. JU1783]|nr:unnamed protein product [Auanema sp. JU1783]